MDASGMPVTGSKKNLMIPLAIVIAGVVIAGAILYINRDSLGSKNPMDAAAETGRNPEIRPVDSTDHILGNPSAPIVIVEYSDLECPFCKDFHATMLQIINEYGAKGEVAWVFRNFPIESNHAKAMTEHLAAECVAELGGNDVYWKYINKIFEVTPANDGLPLAELPKMAVALGVNETAFNSCLESERHKDRIEADIQDAIKAGARGTPFSVVLAGGQKAVIDGAYPYPAMKSVITSILPQVKN